MKTRPSGTEFISYLFRPQHLKRENTFLSMPYTKGLITDVPNMYKAESHKFTLGSSFELITPTIQITYVGHADTTKQTTMIKLTMKAFVFRTFTL